MIGPTLMKCQAGGTTLPRPLPQTREGGGFQAQAPQISLVQTTLQPRG